MKKTFAILTLTALAFVARAQLQMVDLTTRTTNASWTSGSLLTVFGVYTNKSYTTTNPATVTIGDPIPTAFSKVNGNFVYMSNQLFQALLLPNQINMNWQTYSVGLSNYMTTLAYNMGVTNAWIINHVATNHGSGYYFTNGFYWGTFYGDGRNVLISGTNLDTGTVNSNAQDYATLTWLQSLLTPGAHMNFDGGLITSDGSGNLVGTTWRGGLIDNGYSSGPSGYIPVANGDGTWTWQTTNTPPAIVIPDTGGMGGTTIMLNAQDNGTPMYIHVTSLGIVTATGAP